MIRPLILQKKKLTNEQIGDRGGDPRSVESSASFVISAYAKLYKLQR